MHIQQIRLKNFKAFKDEEVLDVENKNLLICGNNGSGKSSLHYALEVFFHNSDKKDHYKKYFIDPNDKNYGAESLLNIYGDPKDYLIELTLKKQNESSVKFQIAPNLTDGAVSFQHQDIINADYASDFISHRLLINFYNFRNSQDANIWFLLEKEIFPYWKLDDLGITMEKWLNNLRQEFYTLDQAYETVVDDSGEKQIRKKKYNKDSNEYKAFQDQISEFNGRLTQLYTNLVPGINTLLKVFLPEENIEIELTYRTLLDTDNRYEWYWNNPELIFIIKYNGINIPKPHIFLNEARLTALALAMRIALFDKKFKGTGDKDDDTLKLLVIDDLLISLDMSFRMKFIDHIQQSESFKGYQIFMITHDKGFFDILKNTLAKNIKDWKWFEFFENNKYPIEKPEDYKNPIIVEKDDYLQVAEDYLYGRNDEQKKIIKNYEISGLYLRKKIEQIIKRFYDPEMENIFRLRILEDLSPSISHAYKEYINSIYADLEKLLVQSNLTVEKIDKLIKLSFDNTNLTQEMIRENGELQTFKRNVLNFVKRFYDHDNNLQIQREELTFLTEEVNIVLKRIMHKAAHHDDSPIFEAELKTAIKLILDFETLILKLKKRTNGN